ncbi:MAG: VWA domain-containing protein [Treponema sp.]|nr:VWA domain-containing protein [Treponema sp.]
MIEIERPYALYALFILIPVIIITIRNYVKLFNSIKKCYVGSADSKSFTILKRLRFSFIGKNLCRVFSFICIILAYSGLSWGMRTIPIPKNGNAVSMVFDISYSMMADDAPGNITRLSSATMYASELLERMKGTAVSVVLAKGSGVIAVPMTEDFSSIYPLLSCISPSYMSSAGTSLGEGVLTAIRSFPVQSSKASSIWLFTDGEETDGKLSEAISEATKYGISVMIIGFGNERETECLAGDGKTYIKTALRTQRIKDAIEAAKAKRVLIGHQRFSKMANVEYIDSTEIGSALKLLNEINFPSQKNKEEEKKQQFAYEVESVPRHNLFMALALILFITSFIFAEFDFSILKTKTEKKYSNIKKSSTLLSIFTIIILFSSCNEKIEGAKTVLQSTWNWHQKKYRQATAGFINAIEEAQQTGDKELEMHALYGLATTYLMQNELDAAEERYKQISPDASDSLKFAALYNAGIIAHRKGNYEDAAQLFKKALEIDSSNENAKINLELSNQQKDVMAHEGQTQVTPVSSTPSSKTVEDAVFSVIQENDKKQWINQQTEDSSNGAEDF